MAITYKSKWTTLGGNVAVILTLSGTYATGGFNIGIDRTGMVLTDFGDTATISGGVITLKSAGTELTAGTAVSGQALVVFI